MNDLDSAVLATMAFSFGWLATGVSLAYFAKALKQRKGGNRGNR